MTLERIKAWPWTGKSNSGQWHVAGIGETTEYVRADLFSAQAAELATLRAERDALRSAAAPIIELLDGLVAESGRGVDWGEEDAFRMGEWFEDYDIAAIERLRALKGGA